LKFFELYQGLIEKSCQTALLEYFGELDKHLTKESERLREPTAPNSRHDSNSNKSTSSLSDSSGPATNSLSEDEDDDEDDDDDEHIVTNLPSIRTAASPELKPAKSVLVNRTGRSSSNAVMTSSPINNNIDYTSTTTTPTTSTTMSSIAMQHACAECSNCKYNPDNRHHQLNHASSKDVKVVAGGGESGAKSPVSSCFNSRLFLNLFFFM
jgi:hypothetical protein